ncbi:snRNA-activating protein complex subunit 4 isoform X2 [Drosophila grimshawi]|uniref:snRNA-activating protein complex subunit 4 isoform X2 n=1 Tax=Drosophila grimshawi TaxID=7222 RepID=UPI000C86F71B|nr:snRNA-activating protein complex subunit 4 isoform X2 [Drosophila grimshawi]
MYKIAESDADPLKLNQDLQRRLEQIRQRILELQRIVRARYERNEQILISRQKTRSYNARVAGSDEIVGMSGAVLRGGTFRFKGNLYFRDVDGRSCPNNEDYERRCRNEMFPTDFDMHSKHVWTVMDKKNIVMGVKQQLLDHAAYTATEVQTVGKKWRKRKAIDLHEQSLANLLKVADSSFSIDWNQISTLDLEHRHSSYSCEAMWLVYLQPQVKREEWTAKEDQILLVAAKDHKMQNWEAIAAKVDRRSAYQCFVRMQTALRCKLEPTSSMKWGQQDSERLRAIVLKNTVNGVVNWSQVAEQFPNRSRSTLIGRYLYVLHPSISHEPFTQKEDVMLFAAVEEYDGKFNCIPRTLFPNRSMVQLRTRYNNVLAQRHKTDSWSVSDDMKLIAFVEAHGTAQWVNCANHLGNHSRTSCRTRSMVIQRFMEQHPDATVADIPRRKVHKSASVTADNWEQCLHQWQADPDSMLNSPPVQKSRSKQSLSDKVLTTYEYFKYAYNLNLRSPAAPIPLPLNERNLHTVANALRFQPPANKVNMIQSVCLPSQLCSLFNKMLCQLPAREVSESSTQLLPPNWSTMMGFRAICILSGQCSNDADSATALKPAISYDESQPAVQLFRQRLRTLFYRTTQLSRLDTTLFEELPAALMKLPRPTVSVDFAETIPLRQRSPEQETQPNTHHSGLTPVEVARKQFEDLNRTKSEPTDLKEENQIHSD